MRRSLLTALAAGSACGLASLAHAQSLSTTTQNNGTGGVFMDLTPSTAPLNLNSFATYFAAGTTTITVWSRPGSYVGFDASSAGWTQHPNVIASGAGTTTLSSTITLANPIPLPAGQTTAVYLQPTAGPAFQYTGTAAIPPQTTWTNADLTLFSDVARTGLVAFGGTRNSPRTFAGRIDYTPGFNPTDPGACCNMDGTCADGTFASCQASGGVFQGLSSTCGTVTCPQPVSCCKNDGTCTNVPPATCAAQGGTAGGAGSTCATANCNGACCNPDGTCTSASTNACTAGGGIFNGMGSLCSGVTCTPFFAEVEPNETRVNATPINLVNQGSVIRGTSTGTATTAGAATSLDQFLVRTPAAAPGIYRHRLAITSAIEGHTGTLRGFTQTAAAAGPWPGPVGTATATDTAAQTTVATAPLVRTNQWYGFGRQEQVFFRVTGATTTTAPYNAVWTSQAVTATDIPGTFQAGVISLSTINQGHTTDTELWVYDGNLNAIDGWGNDDESPNAGGTGATAQSLLRREMTAGTYYVAVSDFPFSNNKGSPCDDDFRTGALMDFPDVVVNNATTTNVNVSFALTDAGGSTPVAGTRSGPFDVAWYRFTVTGTVPTGACCLPDGSCTAVTQFTCLGMPGGVYSGNGSACATANCPQPGGCCFPDGSCVLNQPSACTAAGGTHSGAGVTCAAANCPQPPTGACCLPTGGCAIVWLGGCTSQGGVYGGNNTTCAAPNCLNVVVPNANATVEGASNNSFPFTATATFFHYQQVYGASDFATLTGPHRIRAMHFRPNATSTAPVWQTTFDLDLRFSTTTAGPDSLSATFASNVGPDEALVYSGPVTISTNQVTPITPGPALFDVVINFQTPFVYDPAGGNLLMHALVNGSTIGTSRFLDAVSAVGDPVGRVTTSTVGATTGTVSSVGLVTRFLVEPATPSCYANCDGSTQPPVSNVADFTCFLQKFAASDAYANCDGSTTPPVVNVADFTCFLQKFAAGCP